MNYLKLKQKIYEAIERNPLDRSASLRFSVMRNTSESISTMTTGQKMLSRQSLIKTCGTECR